MTHSSTMIHLSSMYTMYTIYDLVLVYYLLLEYTQLILELAIVRYSGLIRSIRYYLPNMIKGVNSKRLKLKFNKIEAAISLKTKSFLVLCIVTVPFSMSHSSIGNGMKEQDIT